MRRPCVAVVTGARSEFGLLEGTIDQLSRSAVCTVEVVVAGMHLDERLGGTWRDVERRFPVAARVAMAPPIDTPAGMAASVSQGVAGFALAFEGMRPALLLLLGDRTEPFAASLAATYLSIPVAHIHGGDLSGNRVDDFQRDAISRMARLHFAATETSAARLRKLGVRGEISVVGAPGLDAILSSPSRPPGAIRAELGLQPTGQVVVVIYHPQPYLSAAVNGAEAGAVLDAVLEHVAAREGSAVVIYPNNDAGHDAVVDAIEARRGRSGVVIVPSLPRASLLALLHEASILVGNSSAGVIESVSFGLPVVNVGDRQAGRERNRNVVDTRAEKAAVLDALRRVGEDPVVRAAVASRRNLYGDGHAAERIVGAIERFFSQEQVPSSGAQ